MENNVAVVTGGSRGIGRAIAQSLAASGHRVMLSYREREADAVAVVDRIKQQGGDAHCMRADVGAPRDAKALVQKVLDAFGRIDVLVNNAGVHVPGVTLADIVPEHLCRQ